MNTQPISDYLADRFAAVADDTNIDTMLYKSNGKNGSRQFKAGELKSFLAENEDLHGEDPKGCSIRVFLGDKSFTTNLKAPKIDENEWR